MLPFRILKKKQFNFKIVLDLHESFEDSTVSLYLLHTQFVLPITPNISMVHFSKLIKPYWYSTSIINESLYFIHIFSYPVALFCTRVPTRVPPHVPLSCLFRLLLAGAASQPFLPLFWCPWQFQGVLVRYFVERPSARICLMSSSWLSWSYGILEGRPPS